MTNGPKINTNRSGTPLKPVVLVAPLDWGLGHATRCIPVVRALLAQGASVVLAGETKVKTLLAEEFPHLPFVALKGYRIRYSNNKWTLPFVLISQIPKILSSIKYENKRLRKIVELHHIDAVISDNRYGLFDKTRTSIFITHQLKIRTGWGHACDRILQWINYKHIDRFHECWVPDTDSAPGLAGQLSHPPTMPRIAVKYIGPLSRFNAMPSAPEQKHVLILLSGPEPQRTLFENIMLEQLKNFNGATVLVRGLPGHEQEEIKMDTVKIFNHLDTDALRVMMLSASYIICRSGYSSVMDIATLGLKSILVPTPGQTEQEYLGASLMKKKFALCIQQDHFKLQPAIELARTFPYETGHFMFGSKLYLAVQDLLSKLSLVQ